MLERAATAVLCALLPAHFRDRQRDDWRGDLDWPCRDTRSTKPPADLDRDLLTDSRAAIDRLRAQGWTIDTEPYAEFNADVVGFVPTRDADWRFAAHRDGVSMASPTWRIDHRGLAMSELRRTSVPQLDPALMLAVVAPTALLGWLVGCRVHHRARRSSIGTAILAAAVILAPAPLAALAIATRYLLALGPEPDPPWWYFWFVAAGDHPYTYVTAIVVFALNRARRWRGLILAV